VADARDERVHGLLVEARHRQGADAWERRPEVLDERDLGEELRQGSRRRQPTGDGLRKPQHEVDAARVDARRRGPLRPVPDIERHREVERTRQHRVVHGGDRVVPVVRIRGHHDVPSRGQLPAHQRVALEELHDASQDAVVGAVDVVDEEDGEKETQSLPGDQDPTRSGFGPTTPTWRSIRLRSRRHRRVSRRSAAPALEEALLEVDAWELEHMSWPCSMAPQRPDGAHRAATRTGSVAPTQEVDSAPPNRGRMTIPSHYPPSGRHSTNIQLPTRSELAKDWQINREQADSDRPPSAPDPSDSGRAPRTEVSASSTSRPASPAAPTS